MKTYIHSEGFRYVLNSRKGSIIFQETTQEDVYFFEYLSARKSKCGNIMLKHNDQSIQEFSFEFLEKVFKNVLHTIDADLETI